MSARSGDQFDRTLKGYFEGQVASVQIPPPPDALPLMPKREPARRAHLVLELAAAAAIAIVVGSATVAGSWWQRPNELQRTATALFSEYEVARTIDNALRAASETLQDYLED